jgi:CelD/BcsL family acetyltransferase involved in cellulose biosynthesis
MSSVAELDRLEADWDQLSAANPTPFGEHWWTRAWLQAFADPRRLGICTLWDGRDLAGVFALQRRARSASSASNAHSPSFRPLVRDAEALERLSAAVIAACPVLVVEGLPAREEAAGALRRAAASNPLFELEVGAITEGEFLASLERELEAGLQVEASGWKGRAGTAILSQDSTARFYRQIAREAHERGLLRFSSLAVDGRVVAFDLALVAYGRYYLLKIGYDEELRKFAPGLVLRRAVIERCFSTEIDVHEFLGPDMPWKRLFATGDRAHVSLRCFTRRPGALGAFGYRRAVRPAAKRVAVRFGASGRGSQTASS